MSKNIFFAFVITYLSLHAHAQTLDNTLGAEDRKAKKKFGWIAEGPSNYQFFFVGGDRYTDVLVSILQKRIEAIRKF